MDKKIMEELKNKKGREFERTFLKAMIDHHVEGLEMAEMADQKAEDERIRKIAGDIEDQQSKEIREMEYIKKLFDSQCG
jgi:uncharacterized protein (DUF305 family)